MALWAATSGGAIESSGMRDDKLVELILGQAVACELAVNEKLYDQRRYDIVFAGLQNAFGWSRFDLHQAILAGRSMIKSVSDPLKSTRFVLPEEAKEVLLRIVDEVLLINCDDTDFRVYLREKLATRIGAKAI